jgi:hypothetical protein
LCPEITDGFTLKYDKEKVNTAVDHDYSHDYVYNENLIAFRSES